MVKVINATAVRADSPVYWGVEVDSLIELNDGSLHKFGARVCVDKQLPGCPSARIKYQFDALRRAWADRAEESHQFIDGLEMIAGQVIRNG